MRSDTPHAPLAAGIPTYGLRHGRYVWAAGTPPILHAFRDWDVFWITAGEATWTLADGRRLVAGRDQFVVLPPFVPAHVSESRRGLVFWFCHFDFRRVPDDAPRDISGPGASAHVPLAFTRSDAPKVHGAYRALAAIDGATTRGPWRLERAVIALVAELALFA
nr:hypothetical protein [Planctomycetota bacterium]